jgi:hypothetical protein
MVVWIFISLAVLVGTSVVGAAIWLALKKFGRTDIDAWSPTRIDAENQRFADYAELPGSSARTL